MATQPLLPSTLALLDANGAAKLLTLRLMRDGQESQRYTLPINPSAMSITDGPRLQVLQTESGGQAQSFGRMLTEIVISGVTGWRTRPDPNGGVTDGFTTWTNLKGIVDTFIEKSHEDAAHTWDLRLYHWSDGLAWSVVPQPYTVDRTPTLPLFYSYTLRFTALAPLPLPKDPSGQVAGATGDPVRKTVPPTTNPQAARAQLLSIANALALDSALTKDLITLNNTGILSTQEQQLIATQPGFYDRVPASQVLTNVNFPGIATFTGYDLSPRPTGSALALIDGSIYPVVTGIQLALNDQLATIPAPYSNVVAAQTGLQALQASLNTAYSSSPTAYGRTAPAFLMRYLDALRTDVSRLVGFASLFAAP